VERIYVQKNDGKVAWGLNVHLDLEENDPSDTMERLKKDLLQMLEYGV
jgi:hypothetical protein